MSLYNLVNGMNVACGMDMCSSFVNHLTSEIAKELARQYDEMVFELLAPFGITKDNWQENVERISIIDGGLAKHWHIDGEYKFTITRLPDKFSFNEDAIDFEILAEYKVDVYDWKKGSKV